MLKKIVYSFIFFLLISCQNFGQLNILADLPNELKEVSGTEVLRNSNIIWMINDGGNKSTLYGVSKKGKIKKEIEIKHETQKEGFCFKDSNTLLITDEKSHGEGGNLYELKIDVDN